MKTQGKVAIVVATVAAMAVSGIALAEHSPGHGKDKDKGTGPGSNKSIEVVNLCEPVRKDGDDKDGVFLRVTSTITNETGDGVVEPLTIAVSQVGVGALQFVKSDEPPKKKYWDPVGAVHSTPDAGLEIDPLESDEYIVYLDICGSETHPLSENATALNAEVQIMIDDRNFVGQCDDPQLDGDDPDLTDGIDQDINDQSQIDLDNPDYYWIEC